jgi:elongation factor P--(R)-beta-lysine ligase
MSTRPILELRSRIRSGLRDLFDRQGFVEVDTPVLSAEVLPEAHIDPIAVHVDGPHRPPQYLQASPEALMKRLLAADSGPIYQFARSFRAGERGRHHDVEFVLLEWYAPGTTLADAAVLVENLCRTALGTSGIERVTCSEAFGELAGVDPLSAELADLAAACRRAGLEPPSTGDPGPADQQWDRLFEQLLAEVITPRLGHGRPTMLEAWPLSQAAFARIDPDDPRAARRFELFVSRCRTGQRLGGGDQPGGARVTDRSRQQDPCRRRTSHPAIPAATAGRPRAGDAGRSRCRSRL